MCLGIDQRQRATPGATENLPALDAEVIAQLEAAGYTEQQFLLATDTTVVIPVGQTIVVQVTGSDVIHSWTVPAFGVKTDAVPGRLNEGWFLVEEPGIYYGQCSELCGVNHAFMPIEVRVVSQAQFDSWAEFMLAGDYEAAYATVDVFASTEQATQFAAKQ